MFIPGTGFQQWNLGTHSLSVVEIMHGVMKICLVERTESWTSLHGSWSMNINHCCRQLPGRWPDCYHTRGREPGGLPLHSLPLAQRSQMSAELGNFGPACANTRVPAPTQASAKRSEDSVPGWGVARTSEGLACHLALHCPGSCL
ncbi:uncharacterized protein LOC117711622 isoform X2 [Arvicanthis niloticus]|uniref:uncharacterized protein LOC117711622 isoform X2 n=1 Tax=Arvicanthis niloticus TaxID=61156 RepID=UPI001486CA69|nr:uncharacterized protein LOC117711622 isoform X3 [Arvicanthis niloticus]